MQERHIFAREGYTWKSGAKRQNGRRKMIPSFFPGDPLPPGMRVLIVLEMFLSDAKEVPINSIHTDGETRAV